MSDWISHASNSVNRALEGLTASAPKANKPASASTRTSDAGLSDTGRSNVERMSKAGMAAVCTSVEKRVSVVAEEVECVKVSTASFEAQLQHAALISGPN